MEKEFTYGGGKWAKLGFMMLTAKRVEWAETNAKLKVIPVVQGPTGFSRLAHGELLFKRDWNQS